MQPLGPNHDDPLPGQLTIDECIEIASAGSDGKPPAATRRRPSVSEVVRSQLIKGDTDAGKR
jgi:hypothetical protein